jgi:ABC-type branched-subunit amino acid transport system substrate-binding protein
MKHRRWFATLAAVSVFTIVAAACADDSGDNGDNAGGVDCATVEFGCVEVAAGDPINIGVAQVISGTDSTLGQDQVNGIELALDHLDGTFDDTDGQVLGHDVTTTVEDDGCSADGGQTAITALVNDPSVVGRQRRQRRRRGLRPAQRHRSGDRRPGRAGDVVPVGRRR